MREERERKGARVTIDLAFLALIKSQFMRIYGQLVVKVIAIKSHIMCV